MAARPGSDRSRERQPHRRRRSPPRLLRDGVLDTGTAPTHCKAKGDRHGAPGQGDRDENKQNAHSLVFCRKIETYVFWRRRRSHSLLRESMSTGLLPSQFRRRIHREPKRRSPTVRFSSQRPGPFETSRPHRVKISASGRCGTTLYQCTADGKSATFKFMTSSRSFKSAIQPTA